MRYNLTLKFHIYDIYDNLRNSILQLANLKYPKFIELPDLEQLKVIIKLLNNSYHVFLYDIILAGSFLLGNCVFKK